MKQSSYFHLYKWIVDILKKNSGMTFHYFYDNTYKAHYISVFPESKIDEDYCRQENDMYDFLTGEYTDESFIFGTEEKNFKVNASFVKFSANTIPEFDSILDQRLKENIPEPLHLDFTTSVFLKQTSVLIKSINKGKPSSNKYQMQPMGSFKTNLN